MAIAQWIEHRFPKAGMKVRFLLAAPQPKEQIMKRILEIRSAEGGEDAKLFAKDLAKSYTRMFSRFG